MANINLLLVKRHLINTFKNKKVIWLVLLILVANQLGGLILNALIDIDINLTAKYLFEDIWKDIPELINKYWLYLFTILPVLHLSLTLIGLACFRRIAEQFIPGYKEKSNSIASSKSMSLLWFYKQKLFINVGYALFLSAIYLVCWLFYNTNSINMLWLFLLVTFISYPIFYFTQSVVGLLATLPLQNTERSKNLKYLYCRKGIKSLYWFYAVRIAFEMFLAFILPLILLKLGILEFIIPWLMIMGLAVPFSFLRTLSYEIKLQIFEGSQKIDTLLKKDLQ